VIVQATPPPPVPKPPARGGTKQRTPALSQRDRSILQLIDRLYKLEARQVQRRFFGNSLSHVQEILKVLARERRLLYRTTGTVRSDFGNLPYVYSLSQQGVNVLAELGLAEKRRVREADPSPLFWDHLRIGNDFWIGLELLAQRHPTLMQIADRLHEEQLKRRRLPVEVEKGVPPRKERATVTPDAWFELYLGAGQEEGQFWVEIDHNSEDQRQWRGKIQAMVAAFLPQGHHMQSVYQQHYRIQCPDRILVVVVPDKPADTPLRQRNLRHWTMLELERLGCPGFADHFLFSGHDPATVSPEALFFEPAWVMPSDEQLLCLLEGGR